MSKTTKKTTKTTKTDAEVAREALVGACVRACIAADPARMRVILGPYAADAVADLLGEMHHAISDLELTIGSDAQHLAERMVHLVERMVHRDHVNSLGEIQSKGVEIDRNCARLCEARETVRALFGAWLRNRTDEELAAIRSA